MKLMVMSDAHIVKDMNTGIYWCKTAVHGYEFWKRYLDVFDEATIVARVQHLSDVNETQYTRADGPGIHFVELPFIRGAKNYFLHFFELKRIMKSVISDEERGIFRLPSLPTFMLLEEYKKLGRPYAIEVVVDPEDAYRSNFLAKVLLTWKLKKECKKANGVSYVTQFFLEKKYPSKSLITNENSEFFDSYYSSINLEKTFFGKPRNYLPFDGRAINLIHIASAINSDVKGHTTLLHVVKELKEKGLPVTLSCIGDGDKRAYYEEMAKKLAVDDCVAFLGLFSRKEQLKKELEKSDLMIFPSQAEGLPRVLIEAMAVGLPCLSTPVNGIPELLDGKYLFDPFDVDGFVNKVIDLYNNVHELSEMSRQNNSKAYEYESGILRERRNEFYNKLKNCKKH